MTAAPSFSRFALEIFTRCKHLRHVPESSLLQDDCHPFEFPLQILVWVIHWEIQRLRFPILKVRIPHQDLCFFDRSVRVINDISGNRIALGYLDPPIHPRFRGELYHISSGQSTISTLEVSCRIVVDENMLKNGVIFQEDFGGLVRLLDDIFI